MSVYIHIPFCKNICTYCDFSKMYYIKDFVNKYLKSLENEIKSNYKGEKIKTLYIGGGTPSCLEYDELESLFKMLKIFKLEDNFEYTIETNPEDLTNDKIILFKKHNINRVSIGVQTFNEKHLKTLGRGHNHSDVLKGINLLKEHGINNISVDLMYGFSNQTKKEVDSDIEKFLDLDINHISLYSLIIEENTKLYINNYVSMDEDLESEIYFYIKEKLKLNGFNHYEISNYSKDSFESKHNLVYWDNEKYYGFGLSASGYINDIRYYNTRSINNYIKGKYILEKETINKVEDIKNHLMLGFRKIKGINKNEFEKKYGISLYEVNNIKKLLKEGRLKENGEYIYINEEYLYLSNNILVELI